MMMISIFIIIIWKLRIEFAILCITKCCHLVYITEYIGCIFHYQKPIGKTHHTSRQLMPTVHRQIAEKSEIPSDYDLLLNPMPEIAITTSVNRRNEQSRPQPSILTTSWSSRSTRSYSLRATKNIIAVTFSKQEIHFFRSDLWPPMSMTLPTQTHKQPNISGIPIKCYNTM